MIALEGPAKADRMPTTLGWRRRAPTVSHSVSSHCEENIDRRGSLPGRDHTGMRSSSAINIPGGADVVLGPQQAQNFSLALHELATNSAKYGAFEALIRGLVDARERRTAAARGGLSGTHQARNQRRIRSAADPTNPRLSQS